MMASTDEELDGMIIEFFETLYSISETRTQLNNHLKSGYLMMSRSRYSSGARSISSLQYSKDNMTALVKVVNCNDKSEPFLYKRLDTEITRVSNSDDDLEISDNAKNGLRKRIIHKLSHSDSSEKDMIKDEELAESISDNFEMLEIDKPVPCTEKIKPETPESPENITDPLNWFGLLVPESLKRCQTEFKQATMLSVRLVNLQTKLTLLQENYRKVKGHHYAK